MNKIKTFSKYLINILSIVAALISGINAVEGIAIPYATQIVQVIGVVNAVVATYLLGDKTYKTVASKEK